VAGCSRAGRTQPREVAAYLVGRLVSYAFVGAVCGALGEHALHVLPVQTVQLVALLLVAAFALAQGLRILWPRDARVVKLRRPPGPLERAWARVLSVWPRRGGPLGLATGFLPCGMLVPVWMLAATSGDPLSGALVMAVFWAATTPALLLPLVGNRLLRRVPARVQGAAWCALALWLALRPLFMAGHHH
jgi:sulfite exporter TauE/SafE